MAPFKIYIDPELRGNYRALVLQPQNNLLQYLQQPIAEAVVVVAPQSSLLVKYWDGSNYYYIADKAPGSIPSNGILGFPWILEGEIAFKMKMNSMRDIYEYNDLYALQMFLPHVIKTKFLTHMVVQNKFKYSILDYAQPDVLDMLADAGIIELK